MLDDALRARLAGSATLFQSVARTSEPLVSVSSLRLERSRALSPWVFGETISNTSP